MVKAIKAFAKWVAAGVLFTAAGVVLAVLIWDIDFPPGDDGDVIVQKMQRINELATVKWTSQVVVTKKASGSVWQGILPESLWGEEVIVIATGDVRAGVNLDKLEKKDVRVDAERVTINLPKPEILSLSINEKKTGVYDTDRGILVLRGNDDLIEQAREDAAERLLTVSEENGILKQAETNAEASIRELVNSLGKREVVFTR